jgi:hypothetical protein
MDADNIRSPLDQLAQKKKTYETYINIQKSCIHLMLYASCKQCTTKILTNYENNETKTFQLQKIRFLRG